MAATLTWTSLRGSAHDRRLEAVTEFVRVAHPDIELPANVPLSALDHYRQAGWRPVDPEHMTPTEMVEQRVSDLTKQTQLGVLAEHPEVAP